MKTRTKLILAVLAIACVGVAVVGCTKKTNKTNNSADTKAETETSNVSETAEKEPVEPQEVKLEGATEESPTVHAIPGSETTDEELPNPVAGTCKGGAEWSYENNTVTISGTGTFMETPWDIYKDEITAIVIKDGITGGAFACSAYPNLTDITVGKDMETMPPVVFDNCENLTVHGTAGTKTETLATNAGVTFVTIE